MGSKSNGKIQLFTEEIFLNPSISHTSPTYCTLERDCQPQVSGSFVGVVLLCVSRCRVTLLLQQLLHVVLVVCVNNQTQTTEKILLPFLRGLSPIKSCLITNLTLDDFLFEDLADWNTKVSWIKRILS